MQWLSRRQFLRGAELAAAGALLAACQPKVVEKIVKETVVVEKPVEKVVEKEKVVKETVVVTQEKVVQQTVVVEKAVKEQIVIRPVIMAYYWDDAMKALNPDFEAKNPDIKVEFIEVPGWGDYPPKLAAMFASATLGDTVEYNMGPDFHTWAYRGMIRPLDDMIQANKYDTSVFYPAGLESCTYRGHLIAIPQDTHPGTVCVYFNADLLGELGVEEPTSAWDYDQFLQVAQQLTVDSDKDGKTDIWGYGCWNSLRHHYPRLRALGGQHFDPEATRSLAEEAPNIEVLRQFHGLVWTQKVMPVPGATEAADVLYRSGKMAMQNKTPTHVISMTKATEKEFKTEACLIPKNPANGKIGTATTGIGYCMTTLAKQPEAVWRYLDWLGSHWFAVEAFFQGFTGPGGRRDSWGDPQVVSQWPLAGEIAQVLETSEAEEVPANLRTQEVVTTYDATVGELLLDNMTPEECAKRLREELDDILSQPII